MAATGPATDVADLLTQAAAEDPDRLAIVESGGRRVTWGELDDEVGRIATGLGAAGIVAGHRVMIVLGNRIEFVTTYLAVLRAQAVAVPVNPTSQAGELARMVADSGSRMVVADADTVTAVRGAVETLEQAQATDYPAGSIEGDLLARLVIPRIVARQCPALSSRPPDPSVTKQRSTFARHSRPIRSA